MKPIACTTRRYITGGFFFFFFLEHQPRDFCWLYFSAVIDTYETRQKSTDALNKPKYFNERNMATPNSDTCTTAALSKMVQQLQMFVLKRPENTCTN